MASPPVVRRILNCIKVAVPGALAIACGPGLQPQAAIVAPLPVYTDSIRGTLVQFDMVRVPAGTLPDGTVVPAFDVARTETTWDLYDVYALGLDSPAATTEARPSSPYGAPDYGWGHAGFPVMSVTRAAAEEFTRWLSLKTGRTYRLPTEAEWEYVAHLATRGVALDSAGRDALAWHRGNAAEQTHAVASRQADAVGLFDLFGNVAEWVTTSDGALVTRGGSFRDAAAAVGPAARAVQNSSWNARDPQLPKSRWWLSDGPFVGFRIVREPATER